MDAQKLISSELTIALVGVTVSSLKGKGYGDPSTESIEPGARSLPPPRRILAALLFYGFLSLAAGFGDGPARLAAAMGGVTALASLILGTTGKALVTLLSRGAGLTDAKSVAPAPTAGYTRPTPTVRSVTV